jgi:glycylpeptide N-tetradecanoyltransferase
MPSSNSSKTKAPEDGESLELKNTIAADPGAGDESASGSDEEVPMAAASESGPSQPSKKKKKKRSKIARAISALKGDSVPQAVVDQVVAKVKEEHGEDSAAADEETIRELLKQLKLKDVAEGKAGFFGKNQKDTGGHKVCYLCGERNRYLSGIDVARWRSSGRPNPYPTSVRQHIHISCPNSAHPYFPRR